VSVADKDRAPGNGLGEQVSDVIETVKAYALQETVDPLRGLGRFVAFGLLGAIFIGLGCLLLVLAILRFVQSRHVGAFHGTWSFVPYLIALVPCGAGIALAVTRIGKTGLDQREDHR
jgi:hypothetical protein